jgi:hypothetical protein
MRMADNLDTNGGSPRSDPTTSSMENNFIPLCDGVHFPDEVKCRQLINRSQITTIRSEVNGEARGPSKPCNPNERCNEQGSFLDVILLQHHVSKDLERFRCRGATSFYLFVSVTAGTLVLCLRYGPKVNPR